MREVCFPHCFKLGLFISNFKSVNTNMFIFIKNLISFEYKYGSWVGTPKIIHGII